MATRVFLYPIAEHRGGALCLTEGQGGPGVSEPDGGKVGRGGKVFARRTMIIEDRGGSASRTEVIRRYLQKPNGGSRSSDCMTGWLSILFN